MGALETLQAKYGCQMLFVESGGDNLAANYSRELADYIIYVIDVSVSASVAHPPICPRFIYVGADIGRRQDSPQGRTRNLTV